MEAKKHIIIVGAGVCGLTSALELLKKEFEITILEARQRTGGRIHTVREGFSFPVELGAEFMHGKQPRTMAILKEAGIDYTHVSGKFYSWQKGKLEEDEGADPHWAEMMEKLNQLSEDESLGSFLRRNFADHKYTGLREYVRGFVEGYDAADMEKVSALSLRDEWNNSDDERQYRIKGGYSSMIHFLEQKVFSAGGKIFLNRAVQEIGWRDHRVSISTAQGPHYDADAAIVTVPIGVLKKEGIAFNPPLPVAYRDAINATGFGSATKFVFEFNPTFWDNIILKKRKDLAFQFSDAEIPTWWSQLPEKFPLLTGWHGGPSVSENSRDSDILMSKAIASLAYIFECSETAVEANIRRSTITNWTDDPFSLGAYAYSSVHSEMARNVLLKPLDSKLYFAGEALYAGPAMGTVEAAIESGILAVHALEQLYR